MHASLISTIAVAYHEAAHAVTGIDLGRWPRELYARPGDGAVWFRDRNYPVPLTGHWDGAPRRVWTALVVHVAGAVGSVMYSTRSRLPVPLRIGEQLQRDGIPEHNRERLAWGSDLHAAAEKAQHLAEWETGDGWDDRAVLAWVERAEDAAEEVLGRRWGDVVAVAEALASYPGEMLTSVQLSLVMRASRARR